MPDPDTQGRIILSFVAERHKNRRRERDLAAGHTTWSRRLMFDVGKMLIAAGAELQARGQLDFTRPAIAAALSMEMN